MREILGTEDTNRDDYRKTYDDPASSFRGLALSLLALRWNMTLSDRQKGKTH